MMIMMRLLNLFGGSCTAGAAIVLRPLVIRAARRAETRQLQPHENNNLVGRTRPRARRRGAQHALYKTRRGHLRRS